MKILVEHSSYYLKNIGDLAMLRVTVDRLKRKFPEAELLIPTTNVEDFTKHFPEATPIDVKDYHIPPPLAKSALRRKIDVWFRPRNLLSITPTLKVPPYVARFREAFDSADLVISSGGGFLCDTFESHARSVLWTLSAAKRKGKMAGMVGQGVGPVQKPMLAKRVSKVVASLDFFSMRTREHLSLVEFPFVPVNGDDALEIATLTEVPSLHERMWVGVNFRDAFYTGFDHEALERLTESIRTWAEARRILLQPLPIDLSHDTDMKSIKSACVQCENLLDYSIEVTDPESLCDAVDRCSLSVVMSYHAAVFSLARGVPVICVSFSDYYDGKFLGLRSLYGNQMVTILNPSESDTFMHNRCLSDADRVSLLRRESSIKKSKKFVRLQSDYFNKSLASVKETA